MTAIQKYSNTNIIGVENFSDSVIDEFIQSRKASANTNRTYRNAVNQLLKFFATKSINLPARRKKIDSYPAPVLHCYETFFRMVRPRR